MPENNFAEINANNEELAKEYLGIKDAQNSEASAKSEQDTPKVDADPAEPLMPPAPPVEPPKVEIDEKLFTAAKQGTIQGDRAARSFAKARYKLNRELGKIIPEELRKKKELTDEDKAVINTRVNDFLKEEFLKDNHLLGVDIEKELKLIAEKRSNLSRSQREAICAYYLVFIEGPLVNERLKMLRDKPDKTEDDIKLLEFLKANGVEIDEPEQPKEENKEEQSDKSEKDAVDPKDTSAGVENPVENDNALNEQ